jgi:hypothetical protein
VGRPTLIAAPNIQICASHALTGIEAISAPNGRSSRVCRRSADHALPSASGSAEQGISRSERTGRMGTNGTILRQET